MTAVRLLTNVMAVFAMSIIAWPWATDLRPGIPGNTAIGIIGGTAIERNAAIGQGSVGVCPGFGLRAVYWLLRQRNLLPLHLWCLQQLPRHCRLPAGGKHKCRLRDGLRKQLLNLREKDCPAMAR